MPLAKPERELVIVAHGQTDVGRRRERNEDAFLVNADIKLFLVADGMGGHVGGGFASRMAVTTIEEVIRRLSSDPDATLEEGWEWKPGDYKTLLRYAIQAASHRIFEKATQDASLRGMGTTAVAILIQGNTVFLANVGDSRAYLIRGGQIKQVTIDHSLVGEQLRAGVITDVDAKSHRLKNIITRSVGFQDRVEIDIDSRPIRPGDIYLLCTDGLTNLIEDEELFTVVTHNSLKDACQQLIDLANERGGDDNITVLMAEAQRTKGRKGGDIEAEEEPDEPTLEV
ncbi:MAG: Stp1/IreP family PP2C-type Ser/Thr phosphatase [Deltaproteobacteria bacterium]|nr:Stp1/IreP family PP2C-type Ser/Thr phosphatase [Deltaproteobacteria bacterium]